ncbi:tail completion protein gp17 [Bacillus sp. FSL L8-0533]|uniref:tail completion protein gp17 n=1 Tax=Bacillus sp. FSL L8-0533 TaxID=2921524 RepID=UPI00143141E7
MIDFEPIVTKHLLDDPAIQSMTEGRVFAGDFPLEFKAEFPHILVVEMDNVDVEYSDNKATHSEIDIQVNIWIQASESISAIQQAVDQKMKALGCKRITVSSFNEIERNAFRRAFLYRTIVKH